MTYDEFRSAYIGAFKSYEIPRTYTKTIRSEPVEKMAALAEAYPEYLEQLEYEAEEQKF